LRAAARACAAERVAWRPRGRRGAALQGGRRATRAVEEMAAAGRAATAAVAVAGGAVE
jgi:hypothetical protein